MLWLERERPDVWQSVAKLLDVKDYLVARCTGHFITSYDCAHLTWLMDGRPGRKDWSPALMSRVGIARTLLPDIAPAGRVAGPLRDEAAAELGLLRGTPVAVGLGDVSAAAFASGAAGYGPGHISLGSSAWLGAPLRRSRVDPFTSIGSVVAADGEGYLLIAAQENAGSCVGWALPHLGFAPGDFAAFDEAAAAARPSAQAPLFLPWLFGERVPVDDRFVRGAFLSLGPATDKAALARAVYEGVALNIRWAMPAFDRLTGAAGTPLRLVGGGGTSSVWAQILADILERPIEVVAEPRLAGARGAAMAASVAGGWFADLKAAGGMIRLGNAFLPAPGLAKLYRERFRAFTEAYRRLSPWYHHHGRLDG
jgi:xylulokinase